MNDPYLTRSSCYTRLLSEYRAYGRLIVAVDFDDTVFDFHKAGHKYEAVLSLLRRCTALDFYIILFTGSAPGEWPACKDYLSSQGVKISSVNINPFPMPFGNHGKPYYNILLDDRAGLRAAYDTLEFVVTTAEGER